MRRITLCLLPIIAIAGISAAPSCPARCVCEDVRVDVKCTTNQNLFDRLPAGLDPGLQRLIVRNGELHKIDASIKTYTKLTLLDLSRNRIGSINDGTFAQQSGLQQLHLGRNSIRLISLQTFYGLNALTVLSLRKNLIESLGDFTFTVAPRLEELNLGENRISKISKNAFRSLTNLRVLYLDNNLLNSIPSISFKSLNVLAELYIGANALINLNDYDFIYLTELSHLDLSGSLLISLTNDTFENLNQLKILNLSDNKLGKVPSATLAALTRLEELNVGRNQFEVIAKNAFSNLHYLRILNISDCPKLSKLENDAFLANDNLEILIVANNPALSQIEDNAFNNLLHINSISLRKNNLHTLNENWLNWEDVDAIDLSGNPWDCNCHNWRYSEYLKSKYQLVNCTVQCSLSDFYFIAHPAQTYSSIKLTIFFIILILIILFVIASLTYVSIRKLLTYIRTRIYMKNCFHIDNEIDHFCEQDVDENNLKYHRQRQPHRSQQQQDYEQYYNHFDTNLIDDNFQSIDSDYTHFLNSSQDLIIPNNNYNNKPLPIITEL